jgi:hypothetical protein
VFRLSQLSKFKSKLILSPKNVSLRGLTQKGEGTNAGAGSTLAGNSPQSRSNAISAGPATYSGTDLCRLFDLVQVQLPTTSYDG